MAATMTTDIHLDRLDISSQPSDRQGTTDTRPDPDQSDPERPALALHAEAGYPKLTRSRAWIVIIQLCGINLVSSFSNGLLSIGLPTMTAALHIPNNLLLWPSSVFYLSMGTTLLIAGSISDVIGPRKVNLPGTLLTAVTILASGFVKDAISLIMLRAVQGVGNAMVVPTAVSIVANNLEEGTSRNVGFASIFLSMPMGYALGMVLGGVFVSGSGWQTGYYVGGSLGLVLFPVGIWALPADRPLMASIKSIVKRVAVEIDWVGAGIASTSIALLSYVLAMLSADTAHVKQASNIVLLTASLALLPTFAWWQHFQVQRGKPALIPNKLWTNLPFASVCVMILLCNAVVNCMELYSSLFFQEVQLHSAVAAAIRILPQLIVASGLSLLAGVLVNKMPVMASIMASSLLATGSPLLMAVIDPSWNYWVMAVWAQLLAPFSVDVLFTVGTLVVSEAFSPETQSLAGAVFNTFAQVGSSVGLCITAVISQGVTDRSSFVDKDSPQALMKGYRATFWALFAWMVTACVVGGFGLRKMGKVGVKRD